jgi:hypothetical protein
MSKSITFTSTVFLLLLHLLAREASAQSRIDSIYAEVAALKEDYNKKLEALYDEMLEISLDTTSDEHYKVGNFRLLFPTEENMIFMLENIDYETFSYDDDFAEAYPYWSNFGFFIQHYGEEHPALMKKMMHQLEQPQTDEKLFFYAWLFESFFYWNIFRSLSPQETASMIRIMANAVVGESHQRQNLLKIAEMIE